MTEIRSDEDAKMAQFLETLLNRYVNLIPVSDGEHFVQRMSDPEFSHLAFVVANDISRCSISCCFDEADEVQYIFATSYLIQPSVLKEEELFDMISFNLQHFDFDVLKYSDFPAMDDRKRDIAVKRMKTLLALVEKIREGVVDREEAS